MFSTRFSPSLLLLLLLLRLSPNPWTHAHRAETPVTRSTSAIARFLQLDNMIGFAPAAHLLISLLSGSPLMMSWKDKDICSHCGRLIGSIYLHANHVGGDQEYTGLIMPNTLLTWSRGALEGWRKGESERNAALKKGCYWEESSGKWDQTAGLWGGQNDSEGKEWYGVLGGSKWGEKAEKENQMDGRETGTGELCIMLARQSHKRGKRENRGIQTSTEGLLINDRHYVMCRLVWYRRPFNSI